MVLPLNGNFGKKFSKYYLNLKNYEKKNEMFFLFEIVGLVTIQRTKMTVCLYLTNPREA